MNNFRDQTGVIHLFLVLFLVIAIIAGVYLSLHPQIFRSRASNNNNSWMENLNLKDAYGNPIKCDTTQDPPVCYTPSDDISVGWNPNQ